MQIKIEDNVKKVLTKLEIEKPPILKIKGSRNFKKENIVELHNLINDINNSEYCGRIELKTHLEKSFFTDFPLCKDIIQLIDKLVIIDDNDEDNERVIALLHNYFGEKITLRGYISKKDIKNRDDLEDFMEKAKNIGIKNIELQETKIKEDYIKFKTVMPLCKHLDLKSTLFSDQVQEVEIEEEKVTLTRLWKNPMDLFKKKNV